MADRSTTSAVVLAGGASSRLGHDKRRLRLWGEQGPLLLEHTVALVRRLCADVVVVLNDPAAWPELPAHLVVDRIPGAGALGGIYTGLLAARHEYALVVACDMPLLNTDLLRLLLSWPRDYDALVPCSPTAPHQQAIEPLHAIYRRSCVVPIAQAITAGNLRIAALLQHIATVYLAPHEYQAIDPHGLSFLNINRPEDLARAQGLLASQPAPC